MRHRPEYVARGSRYAPPREYAADPVTRQEQVGAALISALAIGVVGGLFIVAVWVVLG